MARTACAITRQHSSHLLHPPARRSPPRDGIACVHRWQITLHQRPGSPMSISRFESKTQINPCLLRILWKHSARYSLFFADAGSLTPSHLAQTLLPSLVPLHFIFVPPSRTTAAHCGAPALGPALDARKKHHPSPPTPGEVSRTRTGHAARPKRIKAGVI